MILIFEVFEYISAHKKNTQITSVSKRNALRISLCDYSSHRLCTGQTDRQTNNRQTDRNPNQHTDRQTYMQTETQTDRQTHGQTDRLIDRQTDREEISEENILFLVCPSCAISKMAYRLVSEG